MTAVLTQEVFLFFSPPIGKLTHLLRDSLGGNSKTSMIICLAMDQSNRDETLSTLQFGARAKRIRCVAKVNRTMIYTTTYTKGFYYDLY